MQESKNKMSMEKRIILGVSLLGLLAMVIGVSYAYWATNVSQKSVNKITSDCLKLNLTSESEAIRLDNAYPLTDEEANLLEPYTFTIENICNTNVDYKVNLEVMNVANRLNSSFIELQVDDQAYQKLTTYSVASESYYKNIYNDNYTVSEKYEFANGSLGAKKSKSYSIKLWMSKDVTLEDDVMNKSFISKVTVGATLSTEPILDNLSDVANIGDYVSYTPEKTSYEITSDLTGYTSNQTINPSELNLWRVIRKNEDGSIDLVSEYTTSTNVYFKGKEGYKKFTGTLNTIASQYETSGITSGSRYVGYDGQTEYISDETMLNRTTKPWAASTTAENSPKGSEREAQGGGDMLYENDTNLIKAACGNTLEAYRVNATNSVPYWLAGRRFDMSTFGWTFNGSYVQASGNIGNNASLYEYTFGLFDQISGHCLRPIVTLKSNIQIISGSGMSESPWKVN